MGVVLGIDAGTTGVRVLAVDEATGVPFDSAYRELTQYFPRPGWVEHDAAEIWGLVRETLGAVCSRLEDEGRSIAAIGVTNQRETVVAWDRSTGSPLARAIVWQDRRTASRCEELIAEGHLPMVRQATGLVLDPYFSATKIEWLLGEGGIASDGNLAFGTVDSWVAWNLTGGPAGGSHITDPSNASRTMLYDIVRREWSEQLCELFGVPIGSLAEVHSSSGRIGVVASDVTRSLPVGLPVSGIAGDQAAALFGQACFRPGMAKNTYGTGSFILMNAGSECPSPAEGLLTSVAWEISDSSGQESVAYALEGAVFVTGAAIQWLRDGLGIIGEASEIGQLAESVPDSMGTHFVPAFTGLGSPYWDPKARGTITGITRGTGGAQLARATVEAIAFSCRDALDAMTVAAGKSLGALRVDGGASVMDLLLQLQADQIQAPVERSRVSETTAVGAAWLAGLAEGVWKDTDELADLWESDAEFSPQMSRTSADSLHGDWLRAVERSCSWA